MIQEEIIQAISDDKTMPFIQPEQLAGIVDFVIKNYNPSLSSNLEEAAEEYTRSEYSSPCAFGGENIEEWVSRIFIAGAEYQRKQDQSLIELAEDHAMLAGMNKMKEEMMEKAVAVEVVGDKRDLRLIDSTERCLFNAKRGDWLKVIVIPEESEKVK